MIGKYNFRSPPILHKRLKKDSKNKRYKRQKNSIKSYHKRVKKAKLKKFQLPQKIS